MIYFLETELKNNKLLIYSLINVYGLNFKLICFLFKKLGLLKNLKVNELTSGQSVNLINLISESNIKLNIDLHKYNVELFNKLIQIKSYRGLRKLYKLPVRGQRTRTNASTSKKLTFKTF
nr:ribosomal protein S13 [Rhizosolenia setigera]